MFRVLWVEDEKIWVKNLEPLMGSMPNISLKVLLFDSRADGERFDGIDIYRVVSSTDISLEEFWENVFEAYTDIKPWLVITDLRIPLISPPVIVGDLNAAGIPVTRRLFERTNCRNIVWLTNYGVGDIDRNLEAIVQKDWERGGVKIISFPKTFLLNKDKINKYLPELIRDLTSQAIERLRKTQAVYLIEASRIAGLFRLLSSDSIRHFFNNPANNVKDFDQVKNTLGTYDLIPYHDPPLSFSIWLRVCAGDELELESLTVEGANEFAGRLAKVLGRHLWGMTISELTELLRYAAREHKVKDDLLNLDHMDTNFSDAPEDAVIGPVARSLLVCAIGNSLQNAQKYKSKGSKIFLAAHHIDKAIYLLIGNEVADLEKSRLDIYEKGENKQIRGIHLICNAIDNLNKLHVHQQDAKAGSGDWGNWGYAVAAWNNTTKNINAFRVWVDGFTPFSTGSLKQVSTGEFSEEQLNLFADLGARWNISGIMSVFRLPLVTYADLAQRTPVLTQKAPVSALNDAQSSFLKEHQVLVINDREISDVELQTITLALRNEFIGDGETFNTNFRRTVLSDESVDSIVAEINSSEPLAELLLVDASMPNSRDGIRLINALRRSDYAGFTYLWSAADVSSDIELFPAMLGKTGCGGFMNEQESALAAKVHSDWETCGRIFRVSDPINMSLIEPAEAASKILSEFLPGCLNSELNDNDPAEWSAACERALALFNGRPGNFESVVRSASNSNYVRLDDAFDSIKLLGRTDSNNHDAIFKALEDLRDALLDAAKCSRDVTCNFTFEHSSIRETLIRTGIAVNDSAVNAYNISIFFAWSSRDKLLLRPEYAWLSIDTINFIRLPQRLDFLKEQIENVVPVDNVELEVLQTPLGQWKWALKGLQTALDIANEQEALDRLSELDRFAVKNWSTWDRKPLVEILELISSKKNPSRLLGSLHDCADSIAVLEACRPIIAWSDEPSKSDRIGELEDAFSYVKQGVGNAATISKVAGKDSWWEELEIDLLKTKESLTLVHKGGGEPEPILQDNLTSLGNCLKKIRTVKDLPESPSEKKILQIYKSIDTLQRILLDIIKLRHIM